MIDSKWTAVSVVPTNRLKRIEFGALKGKSDINPQWRIKAMTEVYGLCGIGWYHELKDKWESTAPNGTVMAFCLVNVYVNINGEWSKPVCGMGGNEIVSIAKGELKQSDEGWKMAYTDALGTALKSLGVASEIYEGNFDGSKYNKPMDATNQQAIDDAKSKNSNTEKSNISQQRESIKKEIGSMMEWLIKFINEKQNKTFNNLEDIPESSIHVLFENLASYKTKTKDYANSKGYTVI
jgi:hypothetical protein